jgi:hypothetical protein
MKEILRKDGLCVREEIRVYHSLETLTTPPDHRRSSPPLSQSRASQFLSR